ncbi:MAG TPA: MFS transporter [Thermomicrobiaceae bacterium]|nr:MFS transporter [Thermomicrobiaceae bacterium]
MRHRFTGLWRHPDFLKLWTGQTVSLLGSQITLLALPLIAVLTLHAGPTQMGLLTAAQLAPYLLVGLFAGVWVDRIRRRPLLIVADVLRAVLLLTIAGAAVLHSLTMVWLYLLAFLFGILTVFFEVAYQSFLPSLVRREHLVEGNAKLEVSHSVAQIAGPSLGGALVSLITAPLAVLADAASFLVSAASLFAIRTPEPRPAPATERRGVRREIGEGLHVVLGNPLLRSIAGCASTGNLFGTIIVAIFVLYATRNLGIAPGLLGLIFAAGNVGVLVGALLAARVPRRLGVGPTIVVGLLVTDAGLLLIPLAGGPRALVVSMLIAAQFLSGFGSPLYNVNQVSLRQTITPDRLQGRMNATMRFLVWGMMPVGSLLGGVLGSALGLRPTLAIGAVGELTAVLWIWLSPVRTLREHPAPVEESTPAVV